VAGTLDVVAQDAVCRELSGWPVDEHDVQTGVDLPGEVAVVVRVRDDDHSGDTAGGQGQCGVAFTFGVLLR